MNRNSHWSIYNPVPMELIRIVAKTVREAPTEGMADKEGKVVYFIEGRGSSESSERIRERL